MLVNQKIIASFQTFTGGIKLVKEAKAQGKLVNTEQILAWTGLPTEMTGSRI